MKLNAKAQSVNTAKEKVLVVGVFQSGKDKAQVEGPTKPYANFLQQLQGTGEFTGARGSRVYVRPDGGQAILFVGLGAPKSAKPETLRVAGANAYKRLCSEKQKAAAVCLESFVPKAAGKASAAYITALMEGFKLSSYAFDKYKTKKDDRSLKDVGFYTKKYGKGLTGILAEVEAAAEAVFVARDLSNEPGNMIYPATLAKSCQQLAKKYGLRCRVLQTADLKKEKMGGILGVGQGSSRQPCMIVLEYKPKKATKSAKKIAFVGKAITFDSGGISIKPSPKMEDMKHDMSGAANMIGAIVLAAQTKCPNHVNAYIMAAENMPSDTSIVPSSILTTRSGKTVEVQNTDAEGRLVLCDGLDYAQDWKPDAVLDMATLTGAVVIALGNVCSAIMGNDESLLKKYKSAADKTEEKHWELPLYKEYSEDMKSKIADLKNIGGDRGAGSSKAGAFLQYFIRPKVKWMHIDCAGSAWDQNHLPYSGQGASGHGVRTLARFARDFK